MTSSEPMDNGMQTPKREKKLRRRADGSPVLPIDPNMPTKTVFLIRHGHSQGQDAKRNGLDRKTSVTLRDCGLSPKGETQAIDIPTLFTDSELSSIQVVISSPLTRALQTALLGFPNHKILVHFDLREVGSKVPENIPRDMIHVLKDLQYLAKDRTDDATLDVESLQPKDWPRDYSPTVVKRDRIRKVLSWLYKERDETTIAIVCHYNVIRAAVVDGSHLKPKNATPIRCQLYSNGDLTIC